MTTHTLADRCVHGYPLWGCPDTDELRVEGYDLTEGTTALAGRWLTVTAIVAALLAAVLIVTWRKR